MHNNPEDLQKATDELIQASHKVAELLYKQAQETGANPEEKELEPDESKQDNQGPIDTDIS